MAAAVVRFWRLYEHALETQPLLTNIANTAVLFAIGDTISQVTSEHKPGQGWNFPALARAIIYGGVIYCIPAHFHYQFNNWLMHSVYHKRLGLPMRLIPLAKICTELFVYWYYFTSAMYHLSMGLMEGIGLQGTIERVRRNFWKTATASWIYWGPASLLNFTFVPLRHQLMITNVLGIGWTTWLALQSMKNRKLEASNI